MPRNNKSKVENLDLEDQVDNNDGVDLKKDPQDQEKPKDEVKKDKDQPKTDNKKNQGKPEDEIEKDPKDGKDKNTDEDVVKEEPVKPEVEDVFKSPFMSRAVGVKKSVTGKQLIIMKGSRLVEKIFHDKKMDYVMKTRKELGILLDIVEKINRVKDIKITDKRRSDLIASIKKTNKHLLDAKEEKKTERKEGDE